MKVFSVLAVLVVSLLAPLTGNATMDSRVAECMSLTGSDAFTMDQGASETYIGILNDSTKLSCNLTAPFTYLCTGETTVRLKQNSDGILVAQEDGSPVEMPCSSN